MRGSRQVGCSNFYIDSQSNFVESESSPCMNRGKSDSLDHDSGVDFHVEDTRDRKDGEGSSDSSPELSTKPKPRPQRPAPPPPPVPPAPPRKRLPAPPSNRPIPLPRSSIPPMEPPRRLPRVFALSKEKPLRRKVASSMERLTSSLGSLKARVSENPRKYRLPRVVVGSVDASAMVDSSLSDRTGSLPGWTSNRVLETPPMGRCQSHDLLDLSAKERSLKRSDPALPSSGKPKNWSSQPNISVPPPMGEVIHPNEGYLKQILRKKRGRMNGSSSLSSLDLREKRPAYNFIYMEMASDEAKDTDPKRGNCESPKKIVDQRVNFEDLEKSSYSFSAEKSSVVSFSDSPSHGSTDTHQEKGNTLLADSAQNDFLINGRKPECERRYIEQKHVSQNLENESRLHGNGSRDENLDLGYEELGFESSPGVIPVATSGGLLEEMVDILNRKSYHNYEVIPDIEDDNKTTFCEENFSEIPLGDASDTASQLVSQEFCKLTEMRSSKCPIVPKLPMSPLLLPHGDDPDFDIFVSGRPSDGPPMEPCGPREEDLSKVADCEEVVSCLPSNLADNHSLTFGSLERQAWLQIISLGGVDRG